MGRHSTSYIAAQQGLSTRSALPGAATYVGRIGSLALALGIGAAVAGGAGIANAESPNDAGTGAGSPGSPSTADSPATDDTAKGPAVADPPAAGAAGVTAHMPGHLRVPKMQLGTSSSAQTANQKDAGQKDAGQKDAGQNDVEPKDADKKPTDGGLGSLPGLIAAIPQKIATVLNTQPPAGPEATPPTDGLSTSRTRAHDNTPPTADLNQTDSTGTDEAGGQTFTSRLADAAAAAIRGDVQPLGAVATSSVTGTTERKSGASPSTTLMAPKSEAKLAATTQVVPTPAARAAPANPIATIVSSFLSALGLAPSASSSGGSPTPQFPLVMAVLQLVRREIDGFIHLIAPIAPSHSTSLPNMTNADPSVDPGMPTGTEEYQTAYGDIGKWMLESDGTISDYGGQPYGGKKLLEPVNVIIVDPTSTSQAEATNKLNTAMFFSGFPAQPIHSTGFLGRIDDAEYGQQPSGPLLGYSDNLFIFTNDHGRIFGPDPTATDKGYVWSGAFSTEQLGLYNFLPTHTYVSSDMARTALAMRLICSGQATYGGMVPLENSYNTDTTTTGDHDGYAVVLILK